MKKGTLYIDGLDAFAEYGIFVSEGGYDELVAMPPLKTPKSNDWHEEDGLEVDLESPMLDSREITVKFAACGILNRYDEFVDLLSDTAYHTFFFAEIRRTYKLRLVAFPLFSNVRTLGIFSLKFADDFPMLGYEYHPPRGRLPHSDMFTIDNRSITDYGIRILEGVIKELTKLPAVKKNQEVKSMFFPGRKYDDSAVTYRCKDVKIPCLIRGNNLDELWRNYDAFLFDLIKPNERLLYSKQLEHAFKCFYKACRIIHFFPTDIPWLQFEITLTITAGLRIQPGEGTLLATELFDLLVTEDDTVIDLLPEPDHLREDDTVLAAEDMSLVTTENDMAVNILSLASPRIYKPQT